MSSLHIYTYSRHIVHNLKPKVVFQQLGMTKSKMSLKRLLTNTVLVVYVMNLLDIKAFFLVEHLFLEANTNSSIQVCMMPTCNTANKLFTGPLDDNLL